MTPTTVSGWLDANVLIRHLVGEPPALARQAGGLLERTRGGRLTLRVHSLTISETVWTLEQRYGVPRTEIARAVGGVLQAEGIECEEADILSDALADYATLGVDFVDTGIRHLARFVAGSAGAGRDLSTSPSPAVAGRSFWVSPKTASRLLAVQRGRPGADPLRRQRPGLCRDSLGRRLQSSGKHPDEESDAAGGPRT